MPTWGPRNTYRATALTVAVWAGVAVVATIMHRYIPPVDAEPALKRFSLTVAWRPTLIDARAESKKTGKPVLVVLYRPTSAVAVSFFSVVNSSRELVHHFNNDFVPVEVNLDDEPGMDSVYVPLYRVANDFEPGLQVVSLDKQGQPANELVQAKGSKPWRELDLLASLAGLLHEAQSPPPTPLSDLASSDIARLRATGVAEAMDVDKEPLAKAVTPTGSHLLALVASGQTDEVKAILNNELSGKGFDWTRQSFIVPYSSNGLDHQTVESQIEYDADRVLVLEQLAGQTGDASYRAMAKIVFDSIVRRITGGAWAGATARTGDDRDRVCGLDWAPEQLSVLGPSAQEFQSYWHLDRLFNPELRPTTTDWRTTVNQWSKWSPKFEKLASSSSCAEVHSWISSRLVVAYVGWRLWPVVCAWGDADRMSAIQKLTDGLLTGSVLSRIPKGAGSRSLDEPITVSLGLFSRYQATGDVRCLTAGKAFLTGVMTQFSDPSGGIVSIRTLTPQDPLVANEAPDVVDHIGPSSASRVVNALWLYGCATPDGAPLRAQAKSLLGKLAPAANSIQDQVDGLLMAAKRVQGGSVTVLMGPNGFKEASTQTVNDPSSTWVAGGDPALWSVAKGGAYRLTDKGLESAAP